MDVLSGVAVVEVEPTVATSMVGRYLTDLGASVTIVEPPGGLAMRAQPPVHPSSGESLLFAYLQHGKSSVEAGDPAVIRELVGSSDFILHSLTTANFASKYAWTPGGAPAISVTPFGDLGPRSGEAATDLSLAAASGLLWLTGYDDAPPVLHYGHQPAYFAALGGVVASLAALLDPKRHRSIAVSQQEVFAGALEDTVPNTALRGTVRKRMGNSLPLTGPLTGLYATKDGGVSLCVFIEPQWEMFCAMVGRPEWLTDARFASWPLRAANGEPIREAIEAWCAEHTSQEAFDTLQTYRIPASILLSPQQLIEEPQIIHRGMIRDAALTDGTLVKVPVLPLASEIPSVPPGAVPRPGQRRDRTAAGPAPLDRDLRSLRVIDLTHAWAGPFATVQVADLGLDVTKVESAARVDQTRLGTPVKSPDETFYPGVDIVVWFQQYNRNKKSISLELKHPEGYDLLMRLIAVSDVVVDNFSGRVMPQLGLGFDKLSAVNPGIVQVRLTGFGLDGPYANTVAYGESLEAGTGLAYLTRSRGRPLRSGIAYPDVAGGYHGAIAILAGLIHRERTGRGVLIDVSERDGTVRLGGEAIAEASVTGKSWLQESSENPGWGPSGVYPCAGDERWLAISCTSDDAWQALAAAIGRPELGGLTREHRRVRRDEIDIAIGAWTSGRMREEAAAVLRAAGVEAEPVLDIGDLLKDRQLVESGSLGVVPHPAIEGLMFPGPPLTVEGRRLSVVHAPLFGEHTDDVLSSVLGLDAAELARLEAAGAIKQMPVFGWEMG